MLHPMNDGTLDVLILGPMGAGVAASEQNCVRLKAAVESLLGHAEFTERLRACGYQRFNVTAPEHLQGNRIANEVFRELDKADLVVLDLSSRPGTTAPSPNVMYELALVHALGLPFMLISSTMDPAPFYVAHDRVRHAAYDKLEATAAELHGPFAAYLDPKNRQNFADNAVSGYYDGAAIIDISAAAGLAAGYYDNFVHRVLREGNGYLARSGGRFKRLITVLPADLDTTAQQQIEDVEALVTSLGLQLESTELKPGPCAHTDPRQGVRVCGGGRPGRAIAPATGLSWIPDSWRAALAALRQARQGAAGPARCPASRTPAERPRHGSRARWPVPASGRSRAAPWPPAAACHGRAGRRSAFPSAGAQARALEFRAHDDAELRADVVRVGHGAGHAQGLRRAVGPGATAMKAISRVRSRSASAAPVRCARCCAGCRTRACGRRSGSSRSRNSTGAAPRPRAGSAAAPAAALPWDGFGQLRRVGPDREVRRAARRRRPTPASARPAPARPGASASSGLMSSSASSGTSASSCDTAISTCITASMSAGGTSRQPSSSRATRVRDDQRARQRHVQRRQRHRAVGHHLHRRAALAEQDDRAEHPGRRSAPTMSSCACGALHHGLDGEALRCAPGAAGAGPAPAWLRGLAHFLRRVQPSATPPTSLLCEISGDRIFSTTGKPMLAAPAAAASTGSARHDRVATTGMPAGLQHRLGLGFGQHLAATGQRRGTRP
jgi:hypothetical protein